MEQMLTLDSPNKIKIETMSEMGNSFLKDVFNRADKDLENVIEKNHQMKKEIGGGRDKIFNQMDYEIGNIISFLGGRGTGKTSAMMSFLYNLNNLRTENGEFISRLQKNEWGKRSEFIWIPCIDASKLVKNDYIMEVILADMWDRFETVVREKSSISNDANLIQIEKKVKNDFLSVYNAYILFKEKQVKQMVRNEKSFVSASELHEQAASTNLRRQFIKLVKDYLDYFGYSPIDIKKEMYFVIAIDDIDMADMNVWGILEEIRMFLSIPQVIILMTADLDKLHQLCECHYHSMLGVDNDISIAYVSEYFDKVLPINLRIYMPEIKRRDESLKILYDSRDDKKESLSEKATILKFVAEKCNIYFDPLRHKRHFLQNNTLRGLQNYFEKIRNLQDDMEYYINWLKEDLNERIIDRIADSEQRSFMRKVLSLELEDLNNYIINYAKSQIKIEKYFQGKENNMGQVLFACSLLERQDAKYIDLVNSIIVYYTIIFLSEDQEEISQKLIGNNIFGEREYSFYTPDIVQDDYIMGFELRSKIEFTIRQTDWEMTANTSEGIIELFNKIVSENESQIYGWICALLFAQVEVGLDKKYKISCEIKDDSEKKRSSTNNENEVTESSPNKVISVQMHNNLRKSIFGFWNYPSAFYCSMAEKIVKVFLETLLNGMLEKKEISLENVDDICNETYNKIFKNKLTLLSGVGAKVKAKATDILPVKNIEILYSVGNILGEKNSTYAKYNDEIMFDMVGRKYNEIYEYLKKLEDYYREINVPFGISKLFRSRSQVRIFLDNKFLTEEQRKYFKFYFYNFYREAAISFTKS